MKNLASMRKGLFAIVAAWDGCRSKYSALNVTFEAASNNATQPPANRVAIMRETYC